MADPNSRPGTVRVAPTPGVNSDDSASQALTEALGSSFLLVRFCMLLLLAAFVFSCVFTVNPNEVAVVLRFGKPRGTGSEVLLKQGLHWALPYPIDEIVRIRTGESKSIRSSVAWYAISPEEEAAGALPAATATLEAMPARRTTRTGFGFGLGDHFGKSRGPDQGAAKSGATIDFGNGCALGRPHHRHVMQARAIMQAGPVIRQGR
jgi:hypothetical protein